MTRKAKQVKPLDYKQMPPDDGMRSGCKVGWRYYKDKTVAEEASKIARHNADIDAAQGYDFGFQVPGSIRIVGGDAIGEMEKYRGMYEVCVS